MRIGFWERRVESNSAPQRCLRYTMDALDKRDDVQVIHGSPHDVAISVDHLSRPGVRDFARDAGVDVVHWTKLMDTTIPLLVDVPTVLTYHGDVHWEAPTMNYGTRPVLTSLKEVLADLGKLWQYDAVCFVSDDLRHRMADRLGPVLPDSYTTHNAAPPALEPGSSDSVLAEYGIDVPYLFHLSVHGPRKNPKNLLEGFAAAAVDQTLVLGGSGWERERAHIERLGIEDRVLLLGFVPEAHLGPLYTDADAFVFPSRHECFGLPPLEAMSCGTPPVVSNRYSMPEVVNSAGEYCDPDDYRSIASAIERAVDREDTETIMTSAGRFTWQRTAQKLVDMYEAL